MNCSDIRQSNLNCKGAVTKEEPMKPFSFQENGCAVMQIADEESVVYTSATCANLGLRTHANNGMQTSHAEMSCGSALFRI